MTNKKRFKANIRLVEFEPHSYCNRKCWFCPNKFIDRQFQPVKFLSSAVYMQVLRDLAGIDYSETLSFTGSCEPFSQSDHTLSMIEIAKKKLPNAVLFSNTNTDYLTTDIVKDIANAGLNMLKCQLYFDEDEEFCDKAIEEKMARLQNKLPGIEFHEKNKNKWFALVNDSMVVVAYAIDFRKVGNNRCDLPIREPQKRYHTCGEAIQAFGINYNCMATPCCNIRSDYPKYKDVLLGKVDDTPGRIFELYQGAILPGDKYPCLRCMGKPWHFNSKIVYDEILSELRNGKQYTVSPHCVGSGTSRSA